jgi:arylsulfatase A-like enzyme
MADRPNIIFILADDLGWADVGCYGGKYYETPHIDRLAMQGTNVLPSDAPLCIHPGKPLSRQAGYTTATVGKWHLGLGAGNVDWNADIQPGEPRRTASGKG